MKQKRSPVGSGVPDAPESNTLVGESSPFEIRCALLGEIPLKKEGCGFKERIQFFPLTPRLLSLEDDRNPGALAQKAQRSLEIKTLELLDEREDVPFLPASEAIIRIA